MRLESYHEVKDFCRQNHLLEPSDRVLVAFSGGADSVYLARALLELSREWDFVVELIHVNHQIRGEEAERDEMFCKSFAEENGIRIHICRGDVPKMVQEKKYSLEEAARIYRYRCIEETAEQYGFQKVAIAHHRDDQAETVLFQMLRGSGVRGMGGMCPRNGRYIRPLLFLCHDQIVRELGQISQSWCEDSTNQEADCSRNQIRLKILPLLEECVNRRASEHLARTAVRMQEVQAFLEEELAKRLPELVVDFPEEGFAGRKELRARVRELQMLPKALQREFAYWMITQAAEHRKDITSRHLEALLALAAGESGKRISLPYGLVAGRDYDILWIRKEYPNKVQQPDKAKQGKTAAETENTAEAGRNGTEDNTYPYWDSAGKEPKSIVLCGTEGKEIKLLLQRKNFFEAFEDNERKIPKNNCTKWFDYAKINGMLEFRHPEEGDFLWLDEQGTRKKPLNRLLIDRHVPREDRRKIWILAEGSHVVWIPELDRVSAGYYVSDRTEEILCIKMITESEKKDERNSTCYVFPGAGGKQD
ncbi:tRNA lysidine(34) synthetase TilS [Jutongia huaianensis]|uniref:tRNA(Ile)-lysidine synthase n=1 Tax=Jutongia huaianensis TaxID=2763668 RepID=A0ABR7N1C9_9FIRM|nr:tRNA lysidine(34) synthetase TilS [Jutongia huaianensis]MBC8562439.1 tRNA lysidine(34) synthetase TilS [Jutongia huaianensis]